MQLAKHCIHLQRSAACIVRGVDQHFCDCSWLNVNAGWWKKRHIHVEQPKIDPELQHLHVRPSRDYTLSFRMYSPWPIYLRIQQYCVRRTLPTSGNSLSVAPRTLDDHYCTLRAGCSQYLGGHDCQLCAQMLYDHDTCQHNYTTTQLAAYLLIPILQHILLPFYSILQSFYSHSTVILLQKFYSLLLYHSSVFLQPFCCPSTNHFTTILQHILLPFYCYMVVEGH